MPIYEYECDKCQNVVEVWQSISEEPKTQCPSCDDGQLKKIISKSAFHLKGGGWYSDGYSATQKSCASGGGCPAKSESAKSDSAPACAKSGASCCA